MDVQSPTTGSDSVIARNVGPTESGPPPVDVAGTKVKTSKYDVRPIDDDPKLPRVLVIGASNAGRYTMALRELIKDKANVHYPSENCRSSRHLVERIDKYLGDQPWDVIQFNCGGHDIALVDENQKAISAGMSGRPLVPMDEYRANLETIVARLKQTGATLIWCTSLPVGEIVRRKPADVDRYNAAAKEIMRKHGIPITELHDKVTGRGKPKWDNGGIHFTDEAYAEMARDIAPDIEEALADRAKTKAGARRLQEKDSDQHTSSPQRTT